MSNLKLSSQKIIFNGKEMEYETSNSALKWRVDTLFEKEPDTINWISQFKANEVFYDIGANVGMYTIFASIYSMARTYAFEPESQNYAVLMRNIVLNKITASTTAYCVAMIDENTINTLHLSDFFPGGSCHTYGANLDFNLVSRSHSVQQGSISWTLDKFIRQSGIPQPHHIKIDVDGLEHLVIKGAKKTLKNRRLKSVLVEANTALTEHTDIVNHMEKLGFVRSREQIDVALRKEGSFEGVGNIIFYRPDSNINFEGLSQSRFVQKKQNNNVLEHIFSKISLAEVIENPFPHFVVNEIFPADFYNSCLENLPENGELLPIGEARNTSNFDSRFVLTPSDKSLGKLEPNRRQFWEQAFNDVLMNTELGAMLIKCFKSFIQNNTSVDHNLIEYTMDSIFMRDKKGYKIPPHTDLNHRILTMMVYLGGNNDNLKRGTGIYQPKNRNTVSPDGIQYSRFEHCDLVKQIPFVPNSCLCFLRTNNSYHGVEEVKEDIERDTITTIVKHA